MIIKLCSLKSLSSPSRSFTSSRDLSSTGSSFPEACGGPPMLVCVGISRFRSPGMPPKSWKSSHRPCCEDRSHCTINVHKPSCAQGAEISIKSHQFPIRGHSLIDGAPASESNSTLHCEQPRNCLGLAELVIIVRSITRRPGQGDPRS